jgi:hypothetical protein
MSCVKTRCLRPFPRLTERAAPASGRSNGPPGRRRAGGLEREEMPDLAAMLMRKSLRAIEHAGERCGGCRRTPLAGERLHQLDSGRLVCELCFAALPEKRRHSVRSERVHVAERRLAVVRKAA